MSERDVWRLIAAVVLVALVAATAQGCWAGATWVRGAPVMSLYAPYVPHGAAAAEIRRTPTPLTRPSPLPSSTPWAPDVGTLMTSDLALDMVEPPGLVRPAGVVRLKYRVVNRGPELARGVTFTAAIPFGYVDPMVVSSDLGWDCGMRHVGRQVPARVVKVACDREGLMLVNTPEFIVLLMGVTTMPISKASVAIQAGVLGLGYDLAGENNRVDWWPGIY